MKLLIISLMLILVYSCSNPLQQNQDNIYGSGKVQISFENTSSVDFMNVTVAGKELGKLHKNASKTAGFDSFGFDTGMPDEDISIIVNNTEINNHNRNFWCGTEKVRADSGNYTIKINIQDTYLILHCENPPYVQYP